LAGCDCRSFAEGLFNRSARRTRSAVGLTTAAAVKRCVATFWSAYR
jgi:hypothetical protein